MKTDNGIQDQARRMAEEVELKTFTVVAHNNKDSFDACKVEDVREAIAAALVKYMRQEPVAWIDEFGNVYPLAARRGPSWVNEHQRNWRLVYASPIPSQQEERVRELEKVLHTARAALINQRRSHHYCEDSWYACPKHEDGCANSAEGEDCNCGADDANREIDEALTAIDAARNKEQGK